MSFRLFETANHSAFYVKYRPQPPKVLIDAAVEFLAEKVPSAEWKLALDVGCGSGQATGLFADRFEQVIGLDVSAGQIGEATAANALPNVQFKVSPAEELPVVDGSVDLISCAQCFHWFNHGTFFKELARVLKPNGVLAVSSYDIPKVLSPKAKAANKPESQELRDLLFKVFRGELLGKHCNWHLADMATGGYKNFDFPMSDVTRHYGKYSHTTETTGRDMIGYLRTWSGYHLLLKEGEDKVEQLEREFEESFAIATGGADFEKETFQLQFDFHLILCRNAVKK